MRGVPGFDKIDRWQDMATPCILCVLGLKNESHNPSIHTTATPHRQQTPVCPHATRTGLPGKAKHSTTLHPRVVAGTLGVVVVINRVVQVSVCGKGVHRLHDVGFSVTQASENLDDLSDVDATRGRWSALELIQDLRRDTHLHVR